jgi:hypothetical protein
VKRPLPPELVELGDALERDVRKRVVDRPVRRQLTLGILATFVITVPMAISVTSAELSRPVSELETAPPAAITEAASLLSPRPSDEFLPRSLRRTSSLGPDDPSLYLVEPTPLRPALR